MRMAKMLPLPVDRLAVPRLIAGAGGRSSAAATSSESPWDD
jgi:hypothetical protein